MGELKNQKFIDLSKGIWPYLFSQGITIILGYLSSVINTQTDFQSRLKKDPSEWKLNSHIFLKIWEIFGKPR